MLLQTYVRSAILLASAFELGFPFRGALLKVLMTFRIA
jgi:hypothetical protein